MRRKRRLGEEYRRKMWGERVDGSRRNEKKEVGS